MSEENKNQNIQVEKAEKEIAKGITKTEEKVDKKEIAQKQADKETNNKIKEETKKIKHPIKKTSKHTEAVVNAKSLPISIKQAIAICNYIRHKNIDKAVSILGEVEKLKKPIPMRGEIPHKKGKIMSGRYPTKAAKELIILLKSLKANALVNELELEKYILFCKANVASRPYKKGGRARFKRTHVTLKLIQPIKKIKKTKK